MARRRSSQGTRWSSCTVISRSMAQSGFLKQAVCLPIMPEHETVEITHGFNDWFEVGQYLTFSLRRKMGRVGNWVGDHIRPRVRVPEKLALAGGREHFQ